MTRLLAARGLHPLDWTTLAIYGAALVVSGAWMARRRQRDVNDYFLAARSIPAWAAAISILATAQSAATFIGVPHASYRGDLTYLMTAVGAALAAIVVAACFVPAYYRHNVTTPYQLLESRFGPAARTAASWTYLVGRVVASGARLFIGAIPASLIAFGDTEPRHVVPAVAVLAIVGILYTLAGGMRSVIWADVIQTVVYLGAAVVALVVLIRSIPASVPEIIVGLAHPPGGGASKLRVIDPGLVEHAPWIDLSREFSLPSAFAGLMLLMLASHGADQDLVQRMLTCRSAARGALSAIGGLVLQLPTVALFLAIGLLLHVFYARPDLAGQARALDADHHAFVDFIQRHMPPGVGGLMLAGLFASGLSAVNSMSSTFVTDCYQRLAPGRSPEHYLRVARAGVIVAGLVLGAFGCLCVVWYDPKEKTLVSFALEIMTFAYAGLLAIFLAALFTRRGSSASAITAIVLGAGTVALLRPEIRAAALPEPIAAWTARWPIIAWPWQLTIATAAAFAACIAVPSKRGRSAARAPEPAP